MKFTEKYQTILTSARGSSRQWFEDLRELLTDSDFYDLKTKVKGSWSPLRKSYQTKMKTKLQTEKKLSGNQDNEYYSILWQMVEYFDKKIKKQTELDNLTNNLEQEAQRTTQQQPTLLEKKLSEVNCNLQKKKSFILEYLQLLNTAEYEKLVKGIPNETIKLNSLKKNLRSH